MTTGFFNGNFDCFQFLERQKPTFFKNAACSGLSPNLFHPGQGKAQDLKKALAICEGCEVRRDCLIYALENEERWGVWGGTSGRQRINWIDKNVSPEDAWEEVVNLRAKTPVRFGRKTRASVIKAEAIEDNGKIKAKIRLPKSADF